jgi:ADP-heptose:LPS heptosyltransferase
MGSC